MDFAIISSSVYSGLNDFYQNCIKRVRSIDVYLSTVCYPIKSIFICITISMAY